MLIGLKQLARYCSRWAFLLCLLLGAASPGTGRAGGGLDPAHSRSQPLLPASLQKSQPAAALLLGSFEPLVIQASRRDTSPDLRTIKPSLAQPRESTSLRREIPNPLPPKVLEGEMAARPTAPFELSPLTTTQLPDPLLSFDGVANRFGGWPPDTQGDIGRDHYVQWINLHFAIWELDKINHTAALVYGPYPGTTLFQGFGGVCEQNNDGDPITLYDPFAERWLMSQFALPNYPNGPFYECIAISTSPDPTGSWHRYEFQMPVNKMNDYPKFGVWPNAYFMSVNQFNAGTLTWAGTGVAALNRQAMLSGAPAEMIYFDLSTVNNDYSSLLPADFDGLLQPPASAPGYFAAWDDSSWLGSADAVRVWEFDVDWQTPGTATFGLNGEPNRLIPTQDVDPSMCGFQRACIAQPGTTNRVDAISDRLMHRLQYRNFGGYETLVSNHTVDVSGDDHAGIHWFELRSESAGARDWDLFQQGVYSPDAHQRWMGSLAMDHAGNLALGYSVSSGSVYPSVRYTGRLAGDPLGGMAMAEKSLVEGTGSQTSSSRWGDYSMMGLDPQDDCTFWYTQEYVAVSGYNTWTTRIGAFRFPGCSIGPQGALLGTVTDSSDSQAIAGAQVRATMSVTQTLGTRTRTDGSYMILAPVGVYTVTATAYGYYPELLQGVEVISGTETALDFALDPTPLHTISGIVKDADTGWPLYARLTVPGTPLSPIWSDPQTGFYSLELPEAASFNLHVEPWLEGYLPASQPVGPLTGDLSLDVELRVDSTACAAPGYQPVVVSVFSSDFEADNGGMSAAAQSGVTTWAWGQIASGPGPAYSGVKGWATNLTGNYQNNENGVLSLPTLDLSGFAGFNPAVSWQQWLKTEDRYDFASLEASKDSGATWQTVYGPTSGEVANQWTEVSLLLDPSYGVADLRLRFRFRSDGSVVYPGWYLDDLLVGAGECLPQSGSLVVGNVFDANTLQPLNGAQLSGEDGLLATAQPTPLDPDDPGGFYALFALQGTQTLTATFGSSYAPDSVNLEAPVHQTIRQDFWLDAGQVSYSPAELQASLEAGQTTTLPLTLTNTGGRAAEFELVELKGVTVSLGPLETPLFAVKPFKADTRTASGAGAPAAPSYPELEAGQALRSWQAVGALGGWAAAYDSANNTVWVSSPSEQWGGLDRLVEYTPDGAATGRWHPHTLPHSSGPADLAYDWNSGRLWVMNVNTGVANCIYEIDPGSGYTGLEVCPGGGTGFELSQRGLAYDPDSDTWFAGSWNDLMVHRFDRNGQILSSVNVGLPISGLAYNPESGHLFAMTSQSVTQVYVLDVAADYTVVGQFSISEGFGTLSGAGLEIDCQGDLWGMDLNADRVYQFTSGESAQLCASDIPWISTQPVTGTLGVGVDQVIDVRFDASIPEADQPGVYSMELKVKEDTPYLQENLPVTMTVSPPPNWGKLSGTVRGLGICDANPQLLTGAEVEIQSSGGLTWTVQTDSSGAFQRWLDQGVYDLQVSAAGHLTQTLNGVTVSSGITTTQGIDLWLDAPCVRRDPDALDVTLKQGKTTGIDLTLENQGHMAVNYAWFEGPGSLGAGLGGSWPTEVDWLSVLPDSGSLPEAASQSAHVNFDAGAPSISQAGVFTASLVLEITDLLGGWPEVIGIVPVTMTVLPLEYGVALSPDLLGAGIPGQAITYTLMVTNTSEGPVDMMGVSLSGNQWPTTAGEYQVGPLSSGESTELVVRVRVPQSALPGEQDQVTVKVTSQGDPSKSASATLTSFAQLPLADLGLVKSVSHDPAWAGLPLTYTLTVTNLGPTAAPVTTLLDVLPAWTMHRSNDSGCTLAGTVLTCSLGTMGVGEERRVHVVVTPLRLGLVVNQAVVTSEAEELNSEDNFSAVISTVQGYLFYFPLMGKSIPPIQTPP